MAMDFVAGTIGGCAGIVVGHPFDLIKVRMQVQPDGPIAGAGNRGGLAGPSSSSRFSGPLDCLRKTINKEGVRGLFKGLGAPVIGNVPIQAIVFGTYGFIRRQLHAGRGDDLQRQSLVEIGAAGFFSGLANSVISSPTELVKIKLQMQQDGGPKSAGQLRDKGPFAGPWRLAKDIYRQAGYRGLYKGFGITAVRDSLAFAIYFSGYEGTLRLLTPADADTSSLDPVRTMVAGCVCGAASWALTYPIDVIKTQVQALPLSDTSLVKKGPCAELMHCVRTSYQSGGISAFFKGLSPTIIRAMPVGAVTFLCFEAVMSLAS